jgi:structural maintenance of chromosome 4
MEGFNFISNKMKEIYCELTNGGDVELELIDSTNPFSKGAKISVKPRKTWSIISLLSGGQKTLVSLSFIYSLHDYKPNSIYFMDEIDAALDYKNRSTVANFIKKRC